MQNLYCNGCDGSYMLSSGCNYQECKKKKKKNPIKSYTVIPKYLGFEKLLKF